MGGGPGSNVPVEGETFFIVESQNFAFFQIRKFSKNVKKINENFSGNFAMFIKFYRHFRENLGKNLENFGNMDL